MASSLLLGCGRGAAFKILKLQAGSLQSLPSIVSLCTKPDGSGKSSTKQVKEATETAQEAIDISTYKNLQHHEYTPFTFVDYDVELSKFRLPQPSSGRVSPRH